MDPLVLADFVNDNSPSGLGNFGRTCTECNQDFDTVGIYEVHLNKVHKMDAMEACDKCATMFKRRMGLIIHFRQNHIKPDEDTYKKALGCDLCDAFLVINGFKSYDDLVEHTAKVHGPDVFINTPGNTGRSKCPLCLGSFNFRKGMIEHLQVIHGEHLISHMLHFTGQEVEKLCKERQFKCSHCERLFTVRKSLVMHMEKIHKDYSGVKYGSSTVNTNKQFSGSYNQKIKLNSDGESPEPRKKRSSIMRSSLVKTEDDVQDSDSGSSVKRIQRVKKKKKRVSSANLVNQNVGIQPCPFCPQVFTRKSILDMHLRIEHPGQQVPKVEKVEIEPEFDPEEDEEEDKPLKVVLKKPKRAKERKRKISSDFEEFEDSLTEDELDESTNAFYSPEEIAACAEENHESFYGPDVPCDANTDPDEEREPCLYPECERKFLSYFSMMRHVAFFHRPVKTAKIMKLKVKKRKVPVGTHAKVATRTPTEDIARAENEIKEEPVENGGTNHEPELATASIA